MSMIRQFQLGLSALWRGARFFGSHRKLWLWAFVPWCLQGLCFVIASWLFVEHSEAIIAAVPPLFGDVTIPESAPGFIHMILGALIGLLRYTVEILVGLFALLATLMAGFVIALILSAPFHDLISEYVEAQLSGSVQASSHGRVRGLARTMRCESQKALLFLCAPVLLFSVNLIPLVGSVISIIVFGLYQMWVTGFSFTDYVLGRRESSFGERMTFARRHRYSLLGLGVAFWIPGALFFGTPLLVTAGTLLHHDLSTQSAPATLD